jgi:hypothetical protein
MALDIGPLQVGNLDIGPLQNAGSGPQTITPAVPAIASGESWGSPTITGGANTIVPPLPAISTGERWFTPDVAGPITVAAIPSGESWPTPSLTVGQTVLVGTASPPTVAIPSGETWYPPRVANVQTVALSAGIPSGESWPTPIVEGSPRWLNVVGIPSGERWYTPTLNGGNQGIFLFLSGQDASAYLSFVDGTCQVTSQTLGRWTATFDMNMKPPGQSQSFIPVLGQTVLMLDFGPRIFSGCITQIITDRFLSTESPNATTFHITATDKSGICDHRVVVGVTYPAVDPISLLPTDVAGVILDIVNNFLNGEGIVPGPEIAPGNLGDLAADLTWNFPTVTQAFDQICTDNGLVWWIDENYVLHFSSLTNLPPAPFSLTESSANYWGPQKDLTIRNTVTTTNYYNKLYAVSNLNILPGSGSGGSGTTGQTGITDNYPNFAVGQPGIIKTFFSPTNTFIATGLNTSVGIGSVLSMTVNGAPQSVIDFTQFSGQVRTGLTDYLWFFGPGTTTVVWTFQPPADAVIVIDYVPASSTNSSNAQYGDALAPVGPSGSPLGTCGSGIYEGVMQLQNVSTIDDLNAIAGAELLRLGGVPTVIDFTTRFPGIRPGQIMNVDIPLSGINNKQVLITQVTGTMIPPNLYKGSAFSWAVEGTTNLDPGNWIKWYERLVGRTVNPLPVLQYEEAVFVLGAGASVASANNITNPYIWGRTGLFVQLLLAASVPPTGQDLVLTVSDGNRTIATITLPATAAANQLFQFNQPTSIPIYVFAGDVSNISASYNIFGSNPTPASGVTLKVRTAM